MHRRPKRLLFCLLCLPLLAGSQPSHPQHAGSWGDQRNGTYINPVLYADYSDPDVIQVEGTYYMVCSEFHYMGMPILESSDMVNWTIVGRIYSRIDLPGYSDFHRYAGGSWAPAIRYHDHRFYVYFCTPDEGLFMSSAEKPEGPWSPLVTVKSIPGWEDPCPFWDEDGKAWLGHSRKGAGPIILHKMSPDGTTLLDEGVTVYTGPTAEGTKIFKLNGYYYISIPEGGVGTGWQTVLRSKNIYGPYEKKVVLEKGTTAINGPHQGALVATPQGQWWFYHFQSDGAMGRVLHLQPVTWSENWPLIGVDIDHNGIGEPVYVWKKPETGNPELIHPLRAPQADDDFGSPTLGLQWESNHNPIPEGWSLTQKPGWLLLKGLKADSFMRAPNSFTQKVMGNTGEVTTKLDGSQLGEGQQAGLCSMSKVYDLVGLRKKNGRFYIFFDDNGNPSTYTEKEVRSPLVYLKMMVHINNHGQNFCLYSLDNKNWIPIGINFEAKWGYWKGTRVGVFSFNPSGNGGTAAFDWFTYDYDGPKEATTFAQ